MRKEMLSGRGLHIAEGNPEGANFIYFIFFQDRTV